MNAPPDSVSGPDPDRDRWPDSSLPAPDSSLPAGGPSLPAADDLDLAASEALDGIAPLTDDRTAADLRAIEVRAAQLRAAIDAVAEPVQQPDTAIRDEQVRRALAAHHQLGDRAEVELAGAQAEPARARAQPAGARARRRLAVAAAVVVLVGAALIVAQLLSGHGSSTETAAKSASGITSPAVQPRLARPSTTLPSSAQPSSAAVDQIPDLGSAADPGALAALVRQHLAETSPASSFGPASTVAGTNGGEAALAPTAPPDATCVTAVSGSRTDLGPLELVARATLAGQAVEVLVFDSGATPSGGRRLVAVRPADCHVLVDRAI